jgi:hypothetical protein
MSSAGNKLTQATKNKISLAKRKYSEPDLIKATTEYLSQFSDPQKPTKNLPTLSGLCMHLNITPATLNSYTTTFENFAQTIDLLLNYQEENLIQRASNDQINVGFAQFLLKAKHRYIDSPQNLTQNNYTNISPGVLAEALKMMNNKE